LINIISNPSKKGEGLEISGKALGILFYSLITKVPISAKSLAVHLREGEKAISTGLRELRDLGFLELRREKFDGRFFTSTQISAMGYKFIGEFLAGISESKHIVELVYGMNRVPRASRALPHNRAGNVAESNISIVSHEGFNSPSNGELDRMRQEREIEERSRERIEEAKRAEALRELEKSTRKRRFVKREDKEVKDWTATDVTFEFDDRIKAYWHLKPSEITKSKFTPALGSARKKHGTNGEIEVLMLDRFFETIKVQEYQDSNALWKMFIIQFTELRQYVEQTRCREGDMERAMKQAAEQWKKEFGETFTQ